MTDVQGRGASARDRISDSGREQARIWRATIVTSVVLFCAGLAVVACAIEGWEPHQAQNSGTVCLEPVTGDDGNALLLVSVELDECLSSVCSRHAQMSCDAVLTGDELVITSAFRWEESTDQDRECIGECAPLQASCVTPPLAPGVYSVRHRGTTKLVWPPEVDLDPRTAVTCL